MLLPDSLIDLVAAAVKVADRGVKKGAPYNDDVGFVTDGLATALLNKALQDANFAERLVAAASE
jgi:hypothetical protein